MACPFFVPREIVHDGSWPHPARLPLGAGWSGTCCASRDESERGMAVQPPHIRDLCNLGYATDCPHLPATRDWDAVRFSVASSSTEQITLSYVCELGHAPLEYGTLSYDLRGEAWQHAPKDPRVNRLATSYLHAYRARHQPSVPESDLANS
ncbi:MAG: hypothetical protein ABSD39_09920 [Terriglobales bacterium]